MWSPNWHIPNLMNFSQFGGVLSTYHGQDKMPGSGRHWGCLEATPSNFEGILFLPPETPPPELLSSSEVSKLFTRFGPLPAFVNKVLLGHAMAVQLRMISGCFPTVRAELSRWLQQGPNGLRRWKYYRLAFYRKVCLPLFWHIPRVESHAKHIVDPH